MAFNLRFDANAIPVINWGAFSFPCISLPPLSVGKNFVLRSENSGVIHRFELSETVVMASKGKQKRNVPVIKKRIFII